MVNKKNYLHITIQDQIVFPVKKKHRSFLHHWLYFIKKDKGL